MSTPSSPAISPANPGVLLIEEYDALAAAIGSALKKFAPHNPIERVRSISDAEKRAEATAPGLFLIDFDPPFPGLSSFLSRMRGLCPDARVLIIGPGVSRQMAAEYRLLGGIQLIEKPFEVADLGAAIQALLGSWQDSAAGRPRGCLRTLTLADVTLAQCAGCRTAVLEIDGPAGKTGEIHVVDGHLARAKTGNHKDAQALQEMFGWQQPMVREVERRSTGPSGLRGKWADIFLAAVLHATAEATATTPAETQVKPSAPAPKVPTGKKVVVVDDTEMLLIFVEDALATADPQLQITTAPNGTTGIKQIAAILPDLVLLDYSLPDINGDEVCRRLLDHNQTAQIPVVMMSGHVPEMTAAAETLNNVVATISKPFLSDALVGLVRQTLSAGLRPMPKSPAPPVRSATPEVRKEPVIAKTPPRPRPVPAPVEIAKESAAAPVPPPEISVRPAAGPSQPPPVAPLPSPAAKQPSHQPQIAAKPVSAPVVSKTGNDVVLGIFLEVVSMQLTPSLRMGAIRAKPNSFTVSLHVSPAALRSSLPVETGFELGRVELNAKGAIESMRVIPTMKPVQRLETRNALQIGALTVVPHDSREHVQLTPAPNAPMMMHLLAHFEVVHVELATNFQVAQLVLISRSNTVQVTLSSEAVGQEQTGTLCETAAVRLDTSARIAELLLNPLK